MKHVRRFTAAMVRCGLMRRVALTVVSIFVVTRALEAQTTNTVAKFNSSGTAVDSAVTEAGGNVGIGATTPTLGILDIRKNSGVTSPLSGVGFLSISNTNRGSGVATGIELSTQVGLWSGIYASVHTHQRAWGCQRFFDAGVIRDDLYLATFSARGPWDDSDIVPNSSNVVGGQGLCQ